MESNAYGLTPDGYCPYIERIHEIEVALKNVFPLRAEHHNMVLYDVEAGQKAPQGPSNLPGSVKTSPFLLDIYRGCQVPTQYHRCGAC